MRALRPRCPVDGREALRIAGIAMALFVLVLALLYLLTGAVFVLLTVLSSS